MSLFNIFDIAASGLSAQNTRLNTVASNLANAESIASTPEGAYKSRQPVFATTYEGQLNNVNNSASAGLRTVGIAESSAENVAQYQPGNPMANDEGYIYLSNVSVIEEMTNMMSAKSSYQSNIEVLNTSKELLLQTLRLGRL
ncbi:MAG: flagellar basal body rod protein FlgC [Gammaproteobacteria bacterium]|nr:MAG: flagellar basal body rod protein FlgC [Gammaproteobacteria bacterium]